MESPIATASGPTAAPPDIDVTTPEEVVPSSTTESPAPPPARGPAGWVQRVGSFLDERTGLSALRYAVPEHANRFWYTLGGSTFVGLLVLVATGMWSAQFYNPDPSGAHSLTRAL
jgi:hypothetical protein